MLKIILEINLTFNIVYANLSIVKILKNIHVLISDDKGPDKDWESTIID